MKKFSKMLALVMAGVLVFGMTAFAKSSSSSSGGSSSGSSNSDRVADSLEEDASAVAPSSAQVGEGVQIVIKAETPGTLEEANKAAKALVGPDATALTVFDVYLADLNGNWVDPTGAVTVTFRNVPGVEAGKNYAVLHYATNKGWEVLPTSVNGTDISATFTSFSPVAIVEVNGNVAAAGVTSPKTGETMPVAALFAVACLGGAAFCAKKYSFNK